MEQHDLIREAVAILVANYAPERILVFGSHATGTATSASDLDLLVVKRTEAPRYKRIAEVEALLSPLLKRIDVNVFTPAEMREQMDVPFSFVRSITQLQGKMVWARHMPSFARANRFWDRMTTTQMHARLQRDPSEWWLYLRLYQRVRRRWAKHPSEAIAARLAAHPDWVVGDFGCGDLPVCRHLPNRTYAMDHIAVTPDVVACDIAHTPIPDGTLDAAVFSLSIMGRNWRDLLREANRTLKSGGRLLIAEVEARWPRPEVLYQAIHGTGFDLVEPARQEGTFLYLEAVKRPSGEAA